MDPTLFSLDLNPGDAYGNSSTLYNGLDLGSIGGGYGLSTPIDQQGSAGFNPFYNPADLYAGLDTTALADGTLGGLNELGSNGLPSSSLDFSKLFGEFAGSAATAAAIYGANQAQAARTNSILGLTVPGTVATAGTGSIVLIIAVAAVAALLLLKK